MSRRVLVSTVGVNDLFLGTKESREIYTTRFLVRARLKLKQSKRCRIATTTKKINPQQLFKLIPMELIEICLESMVGLMFYVG